MVTVNVHNHTHRIGGIDANRGSLVGSGVRTFRCNVCAEEIHVLIEQKETIQ